MPLSLANLLERALNLSFGVYVKHVQPLFRSWIVHPLRRWRWPLVRLQLFHADFEPCETAVAWSVEELVNWLEIMALRYSSCDLLWLHLSFPRTRNPCGRMWYAIDPREGALPSSIELVDILQKSLKDQGCTWSHHERHAVFSFLSDGHLDVSFVRSEDAVGVSAKIGSKRLLRDFVLPHTLAYRSLCRAPKVFQELQTSMRWSALPVLEEGMVEPLPFYQWIRVNSNFSQKVRFQSFHWKQFWGLQRGTLTNEDTLETFFSEMR